MALFRCNKCNYLREVEKERVGMIANCPICQHPGNHVHDTVNFVNQLFQHYLALQNNFGEMQVRLAMAEKAAIHFPIMGDASPQRQSVVQTVQPDAATAWFTRNLIKVEFRKIPSSSESSYEMVAVELGDYYSLLRVLAEGIRNAQSHGHFVVKLGNYTRQQIEHLKRFCMQLHSHSLISRFSLDRNKPDLLHVFVKDSSDILDFFAGGWLEWYVYVKVLEVLLQTGRKVSCLKDYTLTWSNGDSGMFNLFFLLDEKIPLLIECKSSNYRDYLQKYANVRKRLKLDSANFVLLVAGLDQEIADGMSGIFGVTISNEVHAVNKVLTLLGASPNQMVL